MIPFFKGMAEGACDAGVKLKYEEVLAEKEAKLAEYESKLNETQSYKDKWTTYMDTQVNDLLSNHKIEFPSDFSAEAKTRRITLKKGIKHPTSIEDFEEREVSDWLYFAEYSCEGDCVWVVESEVQE